MKKIFPLLFEIGLLVVCSYLIKYNHSINNSAGNLVLLIVAFIILSFFFRSIKNIMSDVEQRKEKRRYLLFQDVKEETKNIETYLREIQKTSSVSEFIDSWNCLKDEKEVLEELAPRVSDSSLLESLNGTCQAIDEIDSDLQWMLCNVIERMKTKAIKDIRTTYKYSDKKKEEVVSGFKEELDYGDEYFSEETRNLANSMFKDVALEAGQGYSFTRNSTRGQNEMSSLSSVRATHIEIDFDHMDGHQFEHFCAGLLKNNGFKNVEVTRASGDQGVDIIAKQGEIRFAFQCKCFSSPVSNKPVQEVFTGKSIYGCQVAVVLTNQYFTQGAIDAARATGVLLWDRTMLRKLIDGAVGDM